MKGPTGERASEMGRKGPTLVRSSSLASPRVLSRMKTKAFQSIGSDSPSQVVALATWGAGDRRPANLAFPR
jgi:hypothetical protein